MALEKYLGSAMCLYKFNMQATQATDMSDLRAK